MVMEQQLEQVMGLERGRCVPCGWFLTAGALVEWHPRCPKTQSSLPAPLEGHPGRAVPQGHPHVLQGLGIWGL